jgi:hypothetical protein
MEFDTPCGPKPVTPTRSDLVAENRKLSVPGPGTYGTLISFAEDGKYFVSKFHDSGSTAMRTTATRFGPDNKTQKIVPGPGQYTHVTTISEAGKNFVSRFESSKSRTFGQSTRDSPTNIKLGSLLPHRVLVTPGPGSYIAPSEFGLYESRNKDVFLAQAQQSWRSRTDKLQPGTHRSLPDSN